MKFVHKFQNLRFVLKFTKKLLVIEEHVKVDHLVGSTTFFRDEYERSLNPSNMMSWLMLVTMISELQKRLKHLGVYEIVN